MRCVGRTLAGLVVMLVLCVPVSGQELDAIADGATTAIVATGGIEKAIADYAQLTGRM